MVVLIFIFFSLIFSFIACTGHSDRMSYKTERPPQAALETKSAKTKSDSSPVKGTYSLMKVEDLVNPSVLKLTFIEGVSIRIWWSEIESQEGKFDWSYLDNALTEVKKANKKAMLRVLPGINSPQWIYNKGIATMEYTGTDPSHKKTYGKKLRAPVPWDETYIREWIKFVDILGKRYSSSDVITLVHIAGATVSSAEMHLPKGKEGGKLTEAAGYSKKKIVNVWKKVMDAYSNAFPGKALALNIAVPFKNDGTLDEVVQYGISKIGTRFCVQGNWLTAHTSDSFYPYKLIFDLHKNNWINIGFQMARASKTYESLQGSLEASVQKGLDAGARYFELYQVDILEESNGKFLEGLNKQLMGTSVTTQATLETNEELWRKLREQVRNVRESARVRDISEAKSEILGIKNTLSKIQAENPEQSEKISQAQASLDQTIRLIESGNRREAKKSFKNALDILLSIREDMN